MTIKEERITSQQEYMSEIEQIATRIEEKYQMREDAEISLLVQSEIDGRRMIMMTDLAAHTLLNARSTPDEFIPYIEGADSIGEIFMGLAYVTVRTDVYRELENRDNIDY
jgi:hypothetical protein